MDLQAALFAEAQHYLVGGVCSSARMHPALGRPFYVSRGDGSKLYDLEGREYIDLCTSYGAALLGHNHPAVNAALLQGIKMGTICAYETPDHARLAKKVCEMVPCLELVRFTGSGTETTMHAIRAAREFTGKSVIVKFEGHFHGYHDALQFNWWPLVEQVPAGQPRPPVRESGGMPPGLEEHLLVLPFNDFAALEVLEQRKDDLAAVILEPINYNSGCICPAPGYLEALRQITVEHGIVLIFDEILSGFRTGPDCAQGYYGVTPDLCTLGKCLGGGVPLSAFGGRRDIMECVTPLGRATHSGTYNGHLLAILAGLAALEAYSQPDFYPHLEALADRLYPGLQEVFDEAGVPARVQGLGARFYIYFGLDEEVTTYAQACRRDRELERRFWSAAIRQGVYFHAGLHYGFSAAHTLEDIERVLEACAAAAREVRKFC